MSENPLDSFISKKKADSQFLTVEDGESAVVMKVREIKPITKTGFGGEEKDVIRLVCDVDTQEGIKTKFFDNGTQRFAQELKDKGVQVGSGFTISRIGQQTKTRYTISNVVGGAAVAPAAPAATTPTASSTTATPVSTPASTTGGEK